MNRDVYIILTVNSWIVFNLTGGWLSHSFPEMDKVHSRRNPVNFREEEEEEEEEENNFKLTFSCRSIAFWTI